MTSDKSLRSIAALYDTRITHVCAWLKVGKTHFNNMHRYNDGKAEREFEKACIEHSLEKKALELVHIEREIRELKEKLEKKLAI